MRSWTRTGARLLKNDGLDLLLHSAHQLLQLLQQLVSIQQVVNSRHAPSRQPTPAAAIKKISIIRTTAVTTSVELILDNTCGFFTQFFGGFSLHESKTVSFKTNIQIRTSDKKKITSFFSAWHWEEGKYSSHLFINSSKYAVWIPLLF